MLFSNTLSYLSYFLQTRQTFRNLPNRLLELLGCGRPVFSFILARNCSMLLQTLQTIRNLRNRLLELYPYWPKTAGCFLQMLHKPSETFQTGSWSCQLWQASETCESGSWSCQLWQAKSFLFYWPETAGCFLQTVQTFRNLPNRFLELPAVASQVFPLLMAPKLPDAPFKCFKPSETFQAGSWRCQLCNKPSLSFSTGPKLPDAPFKCSKPSETSNPALGGTTQPAKPCLGAAKLWAVGSLSTCFLQELPNYIGCDKPNLFFSTGPQLPNAPENAGCFLQTVQTFRNLPNRLLELQNYGLKLPIFPSKPPNLPKPAKPFLGVANYQL